MGRLYTAHNLDTKERLGFISDSAQQAMESLLYILNLYRQDNNATIQHTKSDKHLFTVHSGETWSIRND